MSDPKLKIGLLGATGLVGSEILSCLVADDRVAEVVVYARQPSPTTSSKKVRWISTEFSAEDFGQFQGCDAVMSALGTTIKKAGSKSAFRTIDFDLNIRAATAAKNLACKKFCLVSSQGADAVSAFFYMRTKGEVEGAVASFGFESCVIGRPSLLLGDRRETRFLESASQSLFKKFPWAQMPKLFGQFEPIEAADVALAMVRLALQQQSKRVTIVEAAELRQIAKS